MDREMRRFDGGERERLADLENLLEWWQGKKRELWIVGKSDRWEMRLANGKRVHGKGRRGIVNGSREVNKDSEVEGSWDFMSD
ncbi:unnamed protein product [Anisakis simplex]|uniref:Ovule protein n=1 Tax=Anisakis simplex TaxID=6269 RepID=A0A0M3KFD1_ANISI|nr:unnamed protein product [Anisakis simplex]